MARWVHWGRPDGVYAAKEKGGTGQAEALLCVSGFGRGRCVNLMLGHDVSAMRYPEFQHLLRRSCVWAGHSRPESF